MTFARYTVSPVRRALLLGALIGLAILADLRAASAQMLCGARAAVVAHIENEIGQTVRSMGLSANQIIEVFASEETGTWTITATSVDGTTCLLATGLHYEDRVATPTGAPL